MFLGNFTLPQYKRKILTTATLEQAPPVMFHLIVTKTQ